MISTMMKGSNTVAQLRETSKVSSYIYIGSFARNFHVGFDPDYGYNGMLKMGNMSLCQRFNIWTQLVHT